MSDVSLSVRGTKYKGWKSIRIMRTIEALAGSFNLGVHDRWIGQQVAWPIYEEDDCVVSIDDEQVISGIIDSRAISFNPTSSSLAFAGRDVSALLVDCSAVLDKWTFRNASVVDIARKVCAPFGIGVSTQGGLEFDRIKKLVVNPGETGFSVISNAARDAGVIVVSDGDGGIILTRSTTARATDSLVERENVISADAMYDVSTRFSEYIVTTQKPGRDGDSGKLTRVQGTATDEDILRTARTLIIRPTGHMDRKFAQKRADWEARIRAARADSLTMTVKGWKQRNGSLWPINALVAVRSPTLGIEGDMLISVATHTADSDSGELTELKLVRPDAFTPSPSQNVAKHRSKRRVLEAEALIFEI